MMRNHCDNASVIVEVIRIFTNYPKDFVVVVVVCNTNYEDGNGSSDRNSSNSNDNHTDTNDCCYNRRMM